MTLYKRIAIALAAGALLMLAPAASAQERDEATRVVMNQPAPGPVLYQPFFYDPFLYDSFWYPSPPVYYRQENVGYVKIDSHVKDARIYVDGGFAGLTGKVKKLPLQPGSHKFVLKDADGRPFYQESVGVFLGKTTRIRVD